MRFTYTYRSSDGERHTAEIEAESRDAAFAKVRSELGIKPIKVTAAGDRAVGEGSGKSAASPRWGVFLVIALIASILLIVLGTWWWFGGRGATAHQLGSSKDQASYQVMTPQGPVTLRLAEPLPRQMIPGNRQRIEGDRNSIFTNTAERLLARFAEPGRAVAAPEGEKPTEDDFTACFRYQTRVASNELTEHIDLKRIVAGMKREMQAYLAGGGTVDGYLVELEKRQKLEVSYRERAEKRLEEMLAAANTQPEGRDRRDPSDGLKEAYAYWLKANAQLQAMGIYPLALPDLLRTYQMSLDIDE